MIDKNKTYRCRAGWEVRIYATDGAGETPIHGAFKGMMQQWYDARWSMTGRHDNYPHPTDLDLIEVKPRIKREVWVNVYDDYFCGETYPSKENADKKSGYGRIACVKITIDCEHGDGL